MKLEVTDIMNIIKDERDLHMRLLEFEFKHNADLLELKECNARIEVLNCLLAEISVRMEEE